MSRGLLRSPLGRARGLGSAHQGSQHWWLQRVTGVALVPLTLWLAVSVASLTGADHAQFSAWVAEPVHAIAMLLVVATGFYHLKIGMDVVIEDYVHTEGLKIASLMLSTFAIVVIGAAAAFSVLKLAL